MMEYLLYLTSEEIKIVIKLIIVFTLYWIVDKYEKATNLENMPKQEFDKKLYLPLTDKEKEVFK